MPASHRCKFNHDDNLPECPWASRNCHSPCDIISRSRGKHTSPIGVTGIMTPDGYWPFEDAPAEFNPTAVAVDYINWAQGYPDGWRGSDEMEIAHLAVVEASVRFLTHFVDPQMNMRDALSAYSLTPHGRMLAVASANA